MNTLILGVVVGIIDDGSDDDDMIIKLPVLVLPIVLLLVSITCSV